MFCSPKSKDTGISRKNGNIKKNKDKKVEVPELELRKATNKWTKFIGTSGGKRRTIVEAIEFWVNLRREKSDEEIEDVDTKSVRYDVETLD